MNTAKYIVFIIMLTVFNECPAFRSFFSDRRDHPRKEDLIQVPANATVSSGISVTLGCVANVAIKSCHWDLRPMSNPFTRKHITTFQPDFDQDNPKSEKDCSYTIDSIQSSDSGFWICSAVHFTNGDERKIVLQSKPALIKVLDENDQSHSEKPIITTRVITTTTAATPDTTTTTTTAIVPTELSISESSSTRLQSEMDSNSDSLLDDQEDFVDVGYFTIDRNQTAQEVTITWHMKDSQEIKDCTWISPNRVKLNGKSSSSDSHWVGPNSTCGMKLMGEKPESLSGLWTLIAEYGSGKRFRASLKIDLNPEKENYLRQGRDLLDREPTAFWSSHLFYAIVAGVLAIILSLLLIVMIAYMKLRYRKSPPSSSKDLASLSDIKNLIPSKTYVENPAYHPTLIQERSLPETPDSIKRHLDKSSPYDVPRSIRHSVIGIEGAKPVDDFGIHYSHIMTPPTYLTVLPARYQRSNGKNPDDYYEYVKRPLPPYENTRNVDFTTFGFSSLNRLPKEKDIKSSLAPESDSGLSLESNGQN